MYNKKKLFIMTLLFINSFFVGDLLSQDNSKWIIPVAGVGIVVGGTYLTGRCAGNILLHYIRKWYASDYGMLNTQGIDQFIANVKNNHGDNYLLWIDLNGTFKDYPLLKYKRDIDSYIRLANFLRRFVSSSASDEIKELIEKMKKLREVIMNHPDYLKERKLYVRIEAAAAAAPHVYVNNFR